MDACAWEPGPTSTTGELCGCLGRGSTGPSSRRAGRGPGHKTLGAAPAGEPDASHKGRLGGRLRLALKAGICGGIFAWRVSGARSCSERCLSSRVVATLLANSSAAPARAYPPPAPLRFTSSTLPSAPGGRHDHHQGLRRILDVVATASERLGQLSACRARGTRRSFVEAAAASVVRSRPQTACPARLAGPRTCPCTRPATASSPLIA